MDAISSCDEYYAKTMSTDMLEDIYDDGQSHLSTNRKKARHKLRHQIKIVKAECKGALLST